MLNKAYGAYNIYYDYNISSNLDSDPTDKQTELF